MAGAYEYARITNDECEEPFKFDLFKMFSLFCLAYDAFFSLFVSSIQFCALLSFVDVGSEITAATDATMACAYALRSHQIEFQ